MDSQSAAELINMFSNSDIFLVIFIRMIGFITLMPVLGGRNIPVMARIGLCMILASVVYSSGNVTEIFYYDSIAGYILLLIKEFIVGFIIGFVVYFIFNIAYLAGFLTDQQIGFSMANIFDPITQTQVPITGNLYYFSLCMFLIVSNGHHFVINSIFYSYRALPIGSAVIIGNGSLFQVLIKIMSSFFITGISIALPIIGTVLITDLVLGVLVKTMPQMNVFVVGMPAKIFIGLFAILLVIPMFSNIYNIIYNQMSEAILNVIKVMMP